VLRSWCAKGTSCPYAVVVEPEEGDAVEGLARYLVRPPVSLERMHWDESSDEVVYRRKGQGHQPAAEEHIDAQGGRSLLVDRVVMAAERP